jgi:hypothetical protein
LPDTPVISSSVSQGPLPSPASSLLTPLAQHPTLSSHLASRPPGCRYPALANPLYKGARSLIRTLSQPALTHLPRGFKGVEYISHRETCEAYIIVMNHKRTSTAGGCLGSSVYRTMRGTSSATREQIYKGRLGGLPRKYS